MAFKSIFHYIPNRKSNSNLNHHVYLTMLFVTLMCVKEHPVIFMRKNVHEAYQKLDDIEVIPNYNLLEIINNA